MAFVLVSVFHLRCKVSGGWGDSSVGKALVMLAVVMRIEI